MAASSPASGFRSSYRKIRSQPLPAVTARARQISVAHRNRLRARTTSPNNIRPSPATVMALAWVAMMESVTMYQGVDLFARR